MTHLLPTRSSSIGSLLIKPFIIKKKNSAHINRSIEILICLMSNKHDRKLPTGLNFDRDLSCHFNNYLTKGLIKRFYDCCKLVIHKLTESTKRVFKDITSCIIRPYKYLST